MLIDDVVVDSDKYSVDLTNITFVDAPPPDSVVSVKKVEKNNVSLAQNISNYVMTRTDEVSYHTQGSKLQIDISQLPIIIPERIVCCSYSGLLRYQRDYDIDVINKKIIFELVPIRDRVVQVFAAKV